MRSILFPKPASFKMYADSFKFVGVMAVMATAGFCFSIHTFVKYNVDLWEIILNACDVVTIAVPPALPAAMTIGTEFALERLKKAKIFCISPNRWVRWPCLPVGKRYSRQRSTYAHARGSKFHRGCTAEKS